MLNSEIKTLITKYTDIVVLRNTLSKNFEQIVWDEYSGYLYLNEHGTDISDEGGFYFSDRISAKTEIEALQFAHDKYIKD